MSQEEARKIHDDFFGKGYQIETPDRVYCGRCDVQGPSCDGKEQAIQKWNTRVNEEGEG